MLLALFLAITLLFSSNRVLGAMVPVTSRDTPAHRAVLHFMRGVNLGNDLEYQAGNPAATQTYTEHDLDLIRQEGFDHIRLPVGWHLGSGAAPAYQVSPVLFQKADTLINAALARGLGVILDWHSFDEFMGNPTGSTNKLYVIWKHVATHYAAYSNSLVFDLLNEPNGAATTAVMNGIYPELIRQVHLINPDRTLFVAPGQWSGIGELKTGTNPGLVLPNDDLNLIVTVHCYEPYYFTHQGAEWALPDTATVGVKFPGPPSTPLKASSTITHDWVLQWFKDYNSKPASSNPSSPYSFQSLLKQLRTWADYWGRPVHLSEWGCYEKAENTSRLAFHQAFRTALDAQRLGWAMWDWKAGFHYLKNGIPDPPGMREAIFPPPVLTITDGATIRAEGSLGKTFILQQADPVFAPLQWQGVSTQSLTTNLFMYPIPTNSQTADLYRILWQK